MKLRKRKKVLFVSLPFFPNDSISDQIDFKSWYKIYKKFKIKSANYREETANYREENIAKFIKIHPQNFCKKILNNINLFA